MYVRLRWSAYFCEDGSVHDAGFAYLLLIYVIEQDHDLSEEYIKGLSTADLLAIKRHLHKTDGSSYYSRRHSLGLLGLLDALLRTKRR